MMDLYGTFIGTSKMTCQLVLDESKLSDQLNLQYCLLIQHPCLSVAQTCPHRAV